MAMDNEKRKRFWQAVLCSIAANLLALSAMLPLRPWVAAKLLTAFFLSPEYLLTMLIWPWPAHDTPMLIAAEILALVVNVVPFYFILKAISAFRRELSDSQMRNQF